MSDGGGKTVRLDEGIGLDWLKRRAKEARGGFDPEHFERSSLATVSGGPGRTPPPRRGVDGREIRSMAHRRGTVRRANGIRIDTLDSGIGSLGLEGSGTIPWYVGEGCEFDYEQAKGYTGVRSVRAEAHGDNPWHSVHPSMSHDQLTQDEVDYLSGPHLEELEDSGDVAPMRFALRPVLTEFDEPFLSISDESLQRTAEAGAIKGRDAFAVEWERDQAYAAYREVLASDRMERAREIIAQRMASNPPPPVKERKVHACGFCGTEGHNRRSCPERPVLAYDEVDDDYHPEHELHQRRPLEVAGSDDGRPVEDVWSPLLCDPADRETYEDALRRVWGA